MTYREALADFPNQFKYKAEIVNKEKLKPYRRIIIVGMGGSRLAPDILNMVWPNLDIHIHSDYGLPRLSDDALADALIIANSNSGNTAEVLDAAQTAMAKGYNLAVVTTGGTLAALAQEHGLPHIVMPGVDMATRLNIGRNLVALITLLGLELPRGFNTNVNPAVAQ